MFCGDCTHFDMTNLDQLRVNDDAKNNLNNYKNTDVTLCPVPLFNESWSV